MTSGTPTQFSVLEEETFRRLTKRLYDTDDPLFPKFLMVGETRVPHLPPVLWPGGAWIAAHGMN